MKILKGFALAILGLILFLSLTVFGLAFMVKSTVLNPKFLPAEINRIPIASLAGQFTDTMRDFPPEMRTSLNKTIVGMEPQLKQQTGAAINQFYDYLLGKKPNPELATTLRSTLLSNEFANALIDNTEIANLAINMIRGQSSGPGTSGGMQPLLDQLGPVLVKVEPQLKTQLKAAAPTLLDYLIVNKKTSAEVLTTLRGTILSDSIVNSIIDNLSISPLVANIFKEQLRSQNIPRELQPLLNQIEPAFAKVEPQLKTQLKSGTGPLLDYMVGKTQSFKVTLSFDTVVTELKGAVKDNLLKNPPPELAGIPPAQLGPFIDQFINQNLNQWLAVIPTTITLDEKMLGNQIPSQISQGLPQAQGQITQGLKQADTELATNLAAPRLYIGYFQQYYIWLIVLIIVLIAGIAAIHHSVRGASRGLGSAFLTYGIIEYGSLFAGKFFLRSQVFPTMDIPPEMATFVQQISNDFMAPLEKFSLAVLIIGVVLLIVSFVYPKRQPASTAGP